MQFFFSLNIEEASVETPNFSVGIYFLGPDSMSSTKEAEKTCFANLNQRLKMWRFFDQPIATFVYLFVRYENFTLYHNKKSFFAQILDVALECQSFR